MSDGLVRTPVYQQLNQLLRGLVSSRTYSPAQRFLTEREVANRFGVSRATANKAISNLIAEGVLEYRKGLGTFVRGDRLDNDLRGLVSFTAEAKAAGKVPETQVLQFETLSAADAGEDVAQALRIGGEAQVVRMQRRRCADGQPLIIEWRWVVAELVPGLTREEVGGSIYQVWTERFHLAIAGCEQWISAVNLEREEARQLETAVGAAGLQIRSVGYLSDGRPLWQERTIYRGDGYTFVNRLGRIPGAEIVAPASPDLAAG
jgi:GntR family transcriptional regulator